MALEIKRFLVEDTTTTSEHSISVKACAGGLTVSPAGCEDHDGGSDVIYLEKTNGNWVLYIFADKKQEEPTHRIDFSAAMRDPKVPFVVIETDDR